MYFNGTEFIKLLFTYMFLFIFLVRSLCVKRILAADSSFTFAKCRTRLERVITGAISGFARVFRGTTTFEHLHYFLWNQTDIWSNWKRNKVLSLTIYRGKCQLLEDQDLTNISIQLSASDFFLSSKKMIRQLVTAQKKIYSLLQIIFKRFMRKSN